MRIQDLLGTALTYLFSAIDLALMLTFFDAFGARRWRGRRFWLAAAAAALLYPGWYLLCNTVGSISMAAKMLFSGLLFLGVGWYLYTGIPPVLRVVLTVFYYLMQYLWSVGVMQAVALLCGITYGRLMEWEYHVPYLISAVVLYATGAGLVLAFHHLYPRRRELKIRPRQAVLCMAFPAASLVVLAALLRVVSGHTVSGGLAMGCIAALLLANGAEFWLMGETGRAARDRERLRALDRQIRAQAAGLEAAHALYEAQRRQVHDFRAQLEVLRQLLAQQDYPAAQAYLQAASARQTAQNPVVACRHPALDALFNTKAAAAADRQIDIRFTVGDLSALPFDPADLTVLLANLLDNAMEACARCDAPRVIEVRAAAEGDCFRFSVRNTSRPVTIEGDDIPTTKPDSRLHGFGLANVKAILARYHGAHAMQYADGWFQFAGEMPLG